MRPCPSIVGGARVVCYTPIDERHIKTDNTVHLVAGHEIAEPQGLVIAQYDGEEFYYLFGCNEAWESQSDTWHETLADAKDQAEFEYKGTLTTWLPAQ
jgi:hypothetical protein